MVKGIITKIGEFAGIIAIFLSIFITISLVTHYKWDPSPFTFTTYDPVNYGGLPGAGVSDTLLTIFGSSAFLIPVVLIFYGIRRLIKSIQRKRNLAGVFVLIISVSMFVSLTDNLFHFTPEYYKEGLIGKVMVRSLEKTVSQLGAFLVTISLISTALVLITPVTMATFLRRNTPSDTVKRIRKSKPKPSREKVRKRDKKSKLELKPEDVKEGQFILPPFELLNENRGEKKVMSKNELKEASSILHEKLTDFGVKGNLAQIHPGPVITMYEFEPDPGVKISKVVSVADDLGRAMGGLKVRVTLIPGKTPIGIEVPNADRAIVTMREIVNTDKFRENKSLLTLTLGKDIYGNPIVEDLLKMPHLLVAGTTGSGKSVCVNSMIMSIIFKAKPNEVKMLMIDPKLLELSIYEDIPHLLTRVITNPKDAAEALKKMVLEMERRYRLIAENGARNIDTFNVSVSEEMKLPYIVIIIDELADLMFTASKSVEDSIVRLAQMARAAGIHLILATQRPSVDVITGIIKANFPSRIAFQVSSKVDSRTIIDTHGAEKLLGRGDMLLLNPGMRLLRVHGNYVSEDEIKAVTGYIKAQGMPDFSHFESLLTEEQLVESIEPGERDDLYQEVISYAESIGEVSISSIQRRFKIGYNRAAKIMEMLAEDGLVGPPKGAGKPRQFMHR